MQERKEPITCQNVGIDIGKKEFVASLCKKSTTGTLYLSNPQTFPNNKAGMNRLVKWARKQAEKQLPLSFTMEATGVYYEALAMHLYKLGLKVCVVLANKVKYYAKALNIKTKNDAVDARVIARMGVEQHLPVWTPPAPIYIQLRSITRLLQDLTKQKVATKNYLEALKNSEFADEFAIRTQERMLRVLEKEIEKCKEQIKKVVEKDKELTKKMRYLQTIPAVGLVTAAIIVAETQGFKLITGAKQLASYAGLDVVENQSGKKERKTKISKKGNKRIRAALFMPAMGATHSNKALAEDYNRIIEHKKYKKIGIVALQRKLLLLIYTIWKKEEEFDTEFESRKIKPE